MGTSRKAKYLEYPRTHWNYKIRDNIIGRNILITTSCISSSPSLIMTCWAIHHLDGEAWQKFCSDHLVPTNTWVVFACMIGKVHQSVTSSLTGNKRWVASGWWSKPTSVARDPPVVVEIHSSTSSLPVATRQQRLEDPSTSSRARLELSQAENMNKELFQWRKDTWRSDLSPEGTEFS